MMKNETISKLIDLQRLKILMCPIFHRKRSMWINDVIWFISYILPGDLIKNIPIFEKLGWNWAQKWNFWPYWWLFKLFKAVYNPSSTYKHVSMYLWIIWESPTYLTLFTIHCPYKISTISYTKAVIRLSSEMMWTMVYNVQRLYFIST